MTITGAQIYIGVISSLIAFPASVLVITLFRYAGNKPPPKQKPATTAPKRQLPPSDDQKGGNRAMTPIEMTSSTASTDDIGIAFIDREPETGRPRVIRVKPRETPEMRQERTQTTSPGPKKMELPYWSVHVGYVTAFLVVLVTFYFTVGIALTFGAEVSKNWLISFVVSFFESVLLSQPLKASMKSH